MKELPYYTTVISSRLLHLLFLRTDFSASWTSLSPQVVYDDNERALRGRLENLEAKLVAETEEKMKLREQTDKLRNSLEVNFLQQIKTNLCAAKSGQCPRHGPVTPETKPNRTAGVKKNCTWLNQIQRSTPRPSLWSLCLRQVLESGFAELRLELGACRNRSGALRDDVRALRAALQDKQHLMPRTLKGETAFLYLSARKVQAELFNHLRVDGQD